MELSKKQSEYKKEEQRLAASLEQVKTAKETLQAKHVERSSLENENEQRAKTISDVSPFVAYSSTAPVWRTSNRRTNPPSKSETVRLNERITGPWYTAPQSRRLAHLWASFDCQTDIRTWLQLAYKRRIASVDWRTRTNLRRMCACGCQLRLAICQANERERAFGKIGANSQYRAYCSSKAFRGYQRTKLTSVWWTRCHFTNWRIRTLTTTQKWHCWEHQST